VSNEVLEGLRGELRSLSMRELADIAGFTVTGLRELVRKGKGPPHIRVGKLYRFPVAGVRAWFAEQTNKKKE
jgi:predicted DNA-binding transcriptional regulator AlpA